MKDSPSNRSTARIGRGLRTLAALTVASSLAATSLAACKPNATALFVEVTADPGVLQDLRMVRVRVYSPSTDTLPLGDQPYTIGPERPFPITFNVTTRTPRTVVRIEVDGFRSPTSDPNAVGYVRARAITDFSEGKTLYLPLRFYDVCRDRVTTCEDRIFSQTCLPSGQCGLAEVDKSTLAEVDPMGTIRDAGPRDSGTEMDTGTMDTGVMDTGTMDTGTMDTGTIDTGVIDTGTTDTGVRDTGMDAGMDARTDAGMDVPSDARDAGADTRG